MVSPLGQRFGRLTVESFSHYATETCTTKERGPRTRRKAMYRCQCDCGGIKVVCGRELGRDVNSCGCLRREAHSTRGGEGWVGRIFRNYQRNCRIKGRAWSLTLEQVKEIVTRDCFYCGAKPELRDIECWKGVRFHGIDRVDNDQDYTPGNVVPACKVCNYAKREMSAKDFLAWVARVSGHQARLFGPEASLWPAP